MKRLHECNIESIISHSTEFEKVFNKDEWRKMIDELFYYIDNHFIEL